MGNTAILVANTNYQHQARLDCCANDLLAVQGLIEAAGRYTTIAAVADATADELKTRIREALSRQEKHEEVLFYFTGHGLQTETDFYFCATDFDDRRPNETGLSNRELHELLRSAEPDLVVKITDACNSGTLLVKGDDGFLPAPKAGLKKLIQIASCLESQHSLAGTTLSAFTERFCLAALRKEVGPVYYSDIMSTLRDDYLSNVSQTPHFVSQGTGREVLVEDAAVLADYRGAFSAAWFPVTSEPLDAQLEETREPTLIDKLKSAEERIATPERIEALVDQLFDGIAEGLSASDLDSLFASDIVEHTDFSEPTARNFIIKCLANEKRPDNFVCAGIERTKKKPSPFDLAAAAYTSFYGDDYFEDWQLDLNCTMKRAQLRIALTPRYNSLKRIVLVVTCAPSLENCYIFEVITEHPLTDFGQFDELGSKVVRQWFRRAWRADVTKLSQAILKDLKDAVQKQLEEVSTRLAKNG